MQHHLFVVCFRIARLPLAIQYAPDFVGTLPFAGEQRFTQWLWRTCLTMACNSERAGHRKRSEIWGSRRLTAHMGYI